MLDHAVYGSLARIGSGDGIGLAEIEVDVTLAADPMAVSVSSPVVVLSAMTVNATASQPGKPAPTMANTRAAEVHATETYSTWVPAVRIGVRITGTPSIPGIAPQASPRSTMI